MKQIILLCIGLTDAFSNLSAQTFDISYVTELQYNLNNKVNMSNLLRLRATIPTKHNGEFALETIHIFRTNPERVVNDRQVFSNIEEENLPCGISVLGYTQYFRNSSFFAGIRNLNADYFDSPGMVLFTNSSCGIFPTISANYPVANYPVSCMCIDYKAVFKRWSVEVSLYNGVAYRGISGRNNPFIVNPVKDGVFGIAEICYIGDNGTYFAGSGLHNRYEHPERGIDKRVNCVWWGYAEQCLLKTGIREITLLAQYSRGTYTSNGCKRYFEAGLVWLENRKENTHYIGISVHTAQYGYGNETAAEITYRYNICGNFFIQPAVHLIKSNSEYQKVFLIRLSYNVSISDKRKNLQ